jgi:NADH-quinone oxidoreductase subunit N
VALVLTVIGFGFKIAAVPFHLWAPDAYQGAPTPSAALIASGSKVASFFILARILALGFAGAEGSGEWRNFLAGWMPVLAVCAALSMLLGNFAAIVQTSVKRLLAYSAIAHAGYMALGVIVTGYGGRGQPALAPFLYYVATYALTTVGAFGVVMLVENQTGNDKLGFCGLGKTAPFVVLHDGFHISLAGIPPLAGFVGKFIFAARSERAHSRTALAGHWPSQPVPSRCLLPAGPQTDLRGRSGSNPAVRPPSDASGDCRSRGRSCAGCAPNLL